MTFRSLPVWCLLVILAGCATAEDSDSDMMMQSSEQPAMTASDASEASTAPTPPTAEPATPTMPSSYDVYFANASWLMGDAEESTIDDAVAAAHSLGANTFVVEGYADGTGTERQNMRFSKLRAEAVADALIARGIPQDAIEVSWYGAEAPPDDTPSRKVTIELR